MTDEQKAPGGDPSGEEQRSHWELEKRIFHLKTLYDVSQVIGSLRDVQGISKELLMMVMGTFGALRGLLVLGDLRNNRIEALTHRGMDDGSVARVSRAIEEGSFHALTTTNQIHSLEGKEHGQDGDQGKILATLSSGKIQLWIPFTVSATVKGGIGLGEKLSGEPYSADDQELLSTLANQLTVALDNALAYKEIEQLNRGLEEKVRQRTEELRQEREKLKEANQQLELSNRFIRATFGRYLSDEVVASLLESPEGLDLGGEKRMATLLMSDLRGFTSLTERLAPEQVLSTINRYLGAMVDVILRYQGTINEFIGDAILVIFGAPIRREDDAQRAVACAVAMQQAMASVNVQNRRAGLPEVEMGIGVHTGDVVVGNIGSHKRTKYGVVGSHVNLTSRIESYTVGGQILISESTRRAVGPTLTIERQMEVEAKGVGKPITLYDIRGIGGRYNLFLPGREEGFFPLLREIPVRYTLVEGKHLGRTVFEGHFVKLSIKGGEVRAEYPIPPLSNIKMQLVDMNGKEILRDLYGKVVAQLQESLTGFSVRFTSVPSEASILKLLRHGKVPTRKHEARKPSGLRPSSPSE